MGDFAPTELNFRIFPMKKVLLSLFLIFSCSQPPKRLPASQFANDSEERACLTIRGNGQRIPALWGAMAKFIESYGGPAALSGGSSGMVTAFLTESIYLNPIIANLNNEEHKREAASFLVKSFIGYINYLTETKLFQNILELAEDPETFKSVQNLLSQIEDTNDEEGLKKKFEQLKLAYSVITKSRLRKIAYVFRHKDTQSLMNKELFESFLKASDIEKETTNIVNSTKTSLQEKKDATLRLSKIIEFRKEEFNKGLKAFGNYNVSQNPNIFLRPGPIDFAGLLTIFNRMANFYALYGYEKEHKRKFTKWINDCAFSTINMDWNEIIGRKACERQFNSLVRSHLERQEWAEQGFRYERNQNNTRTKIPFGFRQRKDDLIGLQIPTIAITGVIKGDAVKRYLENKKNYLNSTHPSIGDDFKITLEELGVGYWGTHDQLTEIQRNLGRPFIDHHGREFDFREDLKSQLFTPLPQARWSQVLTTSPAEPGLANLQPIVGTDYLSIGGWMDHYSAPVLKALGCKNVVTITKGDSGGIFSSALLKRLLNIDSITYDELPELTKNGSEDFDSYWGQYYNSTNPMSSANTGLRSADAIICANYDLVDMSNPLKSIGPLFEDGYKAPLLIQGGGDFLKEHHFQNNLSEKDNKTPLKSCFAKSL